MPTFDDFRTRFPSLKNASDEEIIKRTSELFKLPITDVAQDFGYDLSGGQTSQRFGAAIDQYQSGLYGVGETALEGLGAQKASDWMKEQRVRNEAQAEISSARAKELGAVDSFKEAQETGRYGNWLGGLAIQSAPYAAEALVGGVAARGAMSGTRAALTAAKEAKDVAGVARAERALNLGSEVGGVAASYPSAVGDVLSNQREQSGGETRGGVAAALAIPSAALNAVGVESAFMKGNLFKNTVNLLDRPGGIGGAAARTAATATGTALKEGASETGQEMLNQVGRMSVDPNETFLSDAAQERFKESFIGGAALGGVMGGGLGGWRRSGNQFPANDVSQAIQSTDATQTPITTQQFQAPPPPAAPITNAPAAPAVTGGTTDVALGSQQATLDNQQAQAAQQQEQARAQTIDAFKITADPAREKGQFFGLPVYGAQRVNAVADALAKATAHYDPLHVQIANAIQEASAATSTPEAKSKLLNFTFNAENIPKSVQNGLDAIAKVATKFQIDHVTSVEEAAQILNTLSNSVPKGQLEQINAIHQALTGEDTSGYIASQQSQAAKGAKNGKVQQPVQNNAGIREVPVTGGTAEAVAGGDGSVRPTEVQPVGAAGVGAGSLGLQVGQPSAGGIRSGTAGVSAGNGDGQPTSNTQVSGATDVQQTKAPTPSEPGQPAVPAVAEQPVSESGESQVRVYSPALSYYASDLNHIQPKRRTQIRDNLIQQALIPDGKNGEMTLAKRIIMVRMALVEQEPQKDIAKAIGLSEVAVQKQLTRLGIFNRPTMTEAQAAEYASIEERLGIPHGTPDTTDAPRWQAAREDLQPEALAKGLARLKELELQAQRSYICDTPSADSNRALAFDEYLLDLASKFRSSEFPDGIGIGEFTALYAYQPKATKAKDTAVEEASRELEAATLQQLHDAGYGRIGTGGGSQSAVETEDTAFFDKIDSYRQMLESTAPEDTEGRANIEKLLAVEWDRYSKKQESRAKPAGQRRTKVVDEVEGEETLDENGEAPEKQVDEAALAADAWAEFAKKTDPTFDKLPEEIQQAFIDAGESAWSKSFVKSIAQRLEDESNAVQVKSTDEGNVRQPAGGGEEVGQANAKPKKPARARKAKVEAKPVEETKQEVVVLAPQEQYEKATAGFPVPAWADLTKDQQDKLSDLARRGQLNLAAVSRFVEAQTEQQQLTNEPYTIDVEARVVEETIAPQVAQLAAPQVARLEKHYGAKQGTAEFLAKVKEDIVLYATKGAEAVSAAIRDIIHTLQAGVLSVAMIFNPTGISQIESFIVVPQETKTTQQVVEATVPAEVEGMSAAGKQAYATLIPALKAKNYTKFITIADKPAGRVYVFRADGSLVLQKKALFGLAKGDLYKGNNDLPSNRVTPAGLFGIHVVDAAKGGAAAKTAGEYDFGKVFALDDPDATVTFMHSVWLKESDAARRAAALKNQSAADSRYSFGCINLDKDMFRQMVSEYANEMDGSKLFVVPDVQSTVGDFLAGNVTNDKLVREGVKPATKTTTAPVQSATRTATTDRTQVGKEETVTLASNSAPSQFMDFDEIGDHVAGLDLVREQLEEAGIGHAVDLVSDWEITNDASKTAEHGSLRTVHGRYVGTLNIAKLTNEGYAAEVARHEIAHAIDMGPHGGVYSAQPEMGVSVVNGKISAEGPVAKELFNLYQTDTKWKNFLAYPFDSTKHPELNNRTKVQLELFAQAFSIYTTPEGRAFMEQQAPVTAAYFKEVIQDVKSAKPLQIQKAEIAALRAAVLHTRRESKSNRGPSKLLDLDERIDELLASRSEQFQEGLENNLPASVVKPAKSVTATMAAAIKNGLLYAGITEDVVNAASKYMRSAQDYLTAQYARQKTRIDFELRIEAILDSFDKLPKHLQGEGAGSVNRFILDSTMDKKWGFYPGEHRIGTTLFEVDPDLEKRFKAIEKESPAAAQLIRDVFEHGYTALKAKSDAIDAAVEREFAERTKDAQGDADLMDKVAAAKKLMRTQLSNIQNVDFTSPYAYLGRYGDYVVAGKSAEFKHWETRADPKNKDFDYQRAVAWLAENTSNPDHYVVQFAETQGEADAIAADLIATGKFDMDGTEAGPKEDVGSYIGSDVHLAVARLRNLIARQEGEGGQGNADLNRMVSDLYLMTAAENSARKSEIMRKYVAGANGNMMRNLATSGRADAHFLSTMKHNDDVVDALERMRNEAKGNVRNAMPIYNELFKRQTDSLEYKSPSTLSVALTRATSVWFLATSPAFYLQQMLQTTVLSLPYMSGRLGYFRSARAIKAAYNDVAALVKGMGVSEHIDFTKAPADVRTMLQTLVGMGKIDIGIDSDAKARAGENNALNTVMRKLQGLNNRIETVNRATAAIAAYRGYIQRYGNNTDAATKFAAEVVSNTHGSYDGFNTPRVLNNGFGRLVGQFKRFQIIQLSMLGKLIHTSFKGASAEEKAIARRALGFIGGHMAILGGALGVPFVQQIGWLMTKLLGDEDEPDDMEYKLRQMIGDKTMADLLLNGVPAALGVNVGGKLGMGNVASVLPFTDVDLSSRSGYEKMMVGLMGPFIGGLAPKFVDGAGMIAKGEYYKGLELLAPNGIGNAMKGVRYANEGITMRNGDVVLKPEEISMVDAAFQAVGLPTTTITGRQYVQRTEAEFDKFYNERATAVKGAYVNASRAGDGEAMADARQEWQDLQDARRRNGYRIQPMSELFKATVAARKRETSIVNGVETNKGNKQFVAGII